MKTIETKISAAIAETKPQTKARNEALEKIKWKLREACGLYAGIDGLKTTLVESSNALVFDGRDNEALKVRFYNAITGGKFSVELCAS